VKVLIGSDVDPKLPQLLRESPPGDIWEPLDNVPRLMRALGSELPPITWLIRADETIRFATGDYASGYTSRRPMWTDLRNREHELGWHMHLLGMDESVGAFVFEPEPAWLPAAHEALSRHFAIHATRTGWDYGSDFLFGQLDELGIDLDFSALPGSRGWYEIGPTRIVTDWLNTPRTIYRPSRGDYRRPGPDELRLIEVPISPFAQPAVGAARRLAWRLLHGCFSLVGLFTRIKLITDRWTSLPVAGCDVWAFYFHPEDLTEAGIVNFVANLERLRSAGAEFVTAQSLLRTYASH